MVHLGAVRVAMVGLYVNLAPKPAKYTNFLVLYSSVHLSTIRRLISTKFFGSVELLQTNETLPVVSGGIFCVNVLAIVRYT